MGEGSWATAPLRAPLRGPGRPERGLEAQVARGQQDDHARVVGRDLHDAREAAATARGVAADELGERAVEAGDVAAEQRDEAAAQAFDLRWFTPTLEVDMCGHAYLYRREERRRWLLLTGDTLFVFADLPQFTPVASLDLRCARLVATSAPRELQLHTAGRDYHLRASDDATRTRLRPTRANRRVDRSVASHPSSDHLTDTATGARGKHPRGGGYSS